MAKVKQKSKDVKKKLGSPFKDYWTKENYLILSVGFVFLIIGYILMAQGPWDSTLSVSISPVVLLIAYLIIIPSAILFRKKRKENKEANVSSEN